ncbi:hypothetical protein U1Q18_024728 [Sarracenia purpurea var. burkii]
MVCTFERWGSNYHVVSAGHYGSLSWLLATVEYLIVFVIMGHLSVSGAFEVKAFAMPMLLLLLMHLLVCLACADACAVLGLWLLSQSLHHIACASPAKIRFLYLEGSPLWSNDLPWLVLSPAVMEDHAAVMEYHGANTTIIFLVPIAGISWCKCCCHGVFAAVNDLCRCIRCICVLHLAMLLPMLSQGTCFFPDFAANVDGHGIGDQVLVMEFGMLLV